MILKLITGAGCGIFLGNSASQCGATASLLLYTFGILCGYMLMVRCKENTVSKISAITLLFAVRAALFIHPVYELEHLVCGVLSGAALLQISSTAASMLTASILGLASFAYFHLAFSGAGEKWLAFLGIGVTLLAPLLKKDTFNRFAVIPLVILLTSLFPAGNATTDELFFSTRRANQLIPGVHAAMCLPGDRVATSALVCGDASPIIAGQLEKFPGIDQVKTVNSYRELYPLFSNRKDMPQYQAVFCTGNERLCRLASRCVDDRGVLIIPESCASCIPSAFRHWSELPLAPGYIVMARDFQPDTSSDTIERKMQKHLTRCGLKDTVPAGVFSALFDSPDKLNSGVRELTQPRQLTFRLWFLGIICTLYLALRLAVFSHFDKGERRWSALENTASVILVFMLLKKSPDTLFTALLPAAVFLGLPVITLRGIKLRFIQISGAVMLMLTMIYPELINAAQLICAIACGTLWKRIRLEKGAVKVWVDACAICGIMTGVVLYSLLFALNAPLHWYIIITLILRSNTIFRSHGK
jgi:hypothetical protein